jgi:D-alanyl-D-alanine carboxypeptidase/D-alanyl-D-alanine-endopeptidase (penicillin-binding protein 4)
MRLFFYFLSFSFLLSCSPLRKAAMTKTFNDLETEFQDHVGFALYDPAKKKTVYEHNASKYFTPASNTKIFTFYASLKIIGDSVPALRYVEHGDSLIFWGTGDPSFLYHNVFDNGRVYNFLRRQKKRLYYSSANFNTTSFGPGWAWDDYNDYYSVERSPFPIYGNVFTVKLNGELPSITPPFFRQFYSKAGTAERNQFVREFSSNRFRFYPGKRKSSTTSWDIPIRMEKDLERTLLIDTLKKNVGIVVKNIDRNAKIFHSIPIDSVYSEMMQESDNFIAEQLLLMCSGIISDTLQSEIAIRYVKKNFLNDLKDEPSWVDGSGLSRYNLFTPRSIVQLWSKIYEIVPEDRLFALLAVGGKNGTVKNWYKADKPYIFGKTGSLSNNHCLSGFLRAKSGKLLIFSFMNNNFVSSTSKVRTNMQDILKNIYEHY